MPKKKKRSNRKNRNKSSQSKSKVGKSRNTNTYRNTSSLNTFENKKTLLYILVSCLIIASFSLFFIYLPQIRQVLGLQSTVIPSVLRGYRTRLRKIYERHNPEKLLDNDFIDNTLNKWQGKERELFKYLHKKYIKNNRKTKSKKKKNRDNEKYNRDETAEEAGIRRRKEKEKDRIERREKRKDERGGADFYDDWDENEMSPQQRKQYEQYFEYYADDELMKIGDDYPLFEGEIQLFDE